MPKATRAGERQRQRQRQKAKEKGKQNKSVKTQSKTNAAKIVSGRQKKKNKT